MGYQLTSFIQYLFIFFIRFYFYIFSFYVDFSLNVSSFVTSFCHVILYNNNIMFLFCIILVLKIIFSQLPRQLFKFFI